MRAVYLSVDTEEADTADRIAACIHACAGISDEDLAEGVVPARQYEILQNSLSALILAARAAETIIECSSDPESSALQILRRAILCAEWRR
jgi:hypothetical protein